MIWVFWGILTFAFTVYYCISSFFTGDVFERERPSHVCHLAARAGVRASIIDPYIYVHSNIEGEWNPGCHQSFFPFFYSHFLSCLSVSLLDSFPFCLVLFVSFILCLFLSSYLPFFSLSSFLISVCFYLFLFSPRHDSSSGFSSSLWLCEFRICILFQRVREQHQVKYLPI